MSGRRERGGSAAREEVPRPAGDNLIAAGAQWLPCLTLLQVLATIIRLPDRERVAGYIRKSWLYLARFDVRRFGPQHYVDLVEVGLSSPLTIHAICRMSNIQLMVHQGGFGGPSHVFGVSGPIYQAIKKATGYVAMICPGAETFTDADMEEFQPFSAPVAASSGPVTRPTRTPQLRIPHEERQPATKSQPHFRLQDISTLQPDHAAELAAPATQPYKTAACPAAPGRRRVSKPSRPGSSTCAGLPVTIMKPCARGADTACSSRRTFPPTQYKHTWMPIERKGERIPTTFERSGFGGSSVLEDDSRIRLDTSAPPAKTVCF
ncbi:unnamed protein product [Anisakis simplex]|uniref:Retrotransposon protein, putative, unclassified n=1 Tax=Anisakis simplex TaxID=6269 RepID=A0A0M3JW09_ANISI|nr:unnamed protein product [Anisakis simplex]